MKAAYVSPSRETEKRILIDQLNQQGIYETLKGGRLENESYYTLRTMLAAKKAVAQ